MVRSVNLKQYFVFSGLAYATVGLNAGDGRNFAIVPGSNTVGVINISNTSNVGIPGIWVFQANLAEVSGINKECCIYVVVWL